MKNMYALLLFLGVTFFFIFFLFSQVPSFDSYFTGSLFLEAHLYIFFSIVACLIVHAQSSVWKQKHEWDVDISKIRSIIPDTIEIKDFFIDFFSSYIYYIASLFWYFAIYLITKSFSPDLDIAYIFLVFNIVVVTLYFLPRSTTLWKDLIIVNLVLISLYYIWENIFYLFWFSQNLSFVDVINILLVFLLFSIALFNKQYKDYKTLVEQYFIIFLFLELAVLYKWIFWGNILSIWIIAGIIGSNLLVFTDKIQELFTISKNTSRTWGLVYSAVSVVIFSILLYVQGEQIFTYGLWVLGISILMILFHKRFCSYFAMTLWTLWMTAFFHLSYVVIFQNIYAYIFIVYVFMSFLLMHIFKQIKTHYDFDRYFFRIISVLVNLIWVILFLFFNEVSILSIWLLFLGESIYLFFIYYSLRKNNF